MWCLGCRYQSGRCVARGTHKFSWHYVSEISDRKLTHTKGFNQRDLTPILVGVPTCSDAGFDSSSLMPPPDVTFDFCYAPACPELEYSGRMDSYWKGCCLFGGGVGQEVGGVIVLWNVVEVMVRTCLWTSSWFPENFLGDGCPVLVSVSRPLPCSLASSPLSMLNMFLPACSRHNLMGIVVDVAICARPPISPPRHLRAANVTQSQP